MIPVAQSVHGHFSRGERRAEWLVDTLNAARLAVGVASGKRGSVCGSSASALPLKPVVQEYASVEAPEASHAKQALRQLEFETLRVTGQHRCHAEEDAVAD